MVTQNSTFEANEIFWLMLPFIFFVFINSRLQHVRFKKKCRRCVLIWLVTKVMCLQSNNYIRYNFSCSFWKILLYNPMTLLLFQNTTKEHMTEFHPVTCLLASLEYMGMFLSVVLGLNRLSIIYPLFSSILQWSWSCSDVGVVSSFRAQASL